MTTPDADLSIDEYLRERLMPVEGAIPHIPGIEMYGESARDICNALLEHATKEDDSLRQIGEEDLMDDKTVFIIKRQ